MKEIKCYEQIVGKHFDVMVLERSTFPHHKVEIAVLEVRDDEELLKLLVIGVSLRVGDHGLQLDCEAVRLYLFQHKQNVDFTGEHYKVLLGQEFVVGADVNNLDSHVLLGIQVERLIDGTE